MTNDPEDMKERVGDLCMKSFNRQIYEEWVLFYIPDICEDDLKFVCNRAASLYQAINDRCTDNFRASYLNEEGDMSEKYKLSRKGGCCGFVDNVYVNPVTGKTFIIGFNYGH